MDTRAQGGGDSHECDMCGETFPTEQELEQHVADRHAGDDKAVPAGTGGSRTEGGAGMVQTE
jgi:hypothetical protein